jgi:streptogramin lyase
MRPGRLFFAVAVLGTLFAAVARAQLITEFTAPQTNSEPGAVTLGSDGNMWVSAVNAHEFLRITPEGVMTEFPLGIANGGANLLTSGPDGNLWFTDSGTDKIGRMTTAGVVTEFPVLTASPGLVGIVSGPDGNLWFVEAHSNAAKIGRITTAGVVTEFSIPAGGVTLQIAAGSDGNLWFTEFQANKIGRITTSGVVTEFDVPTADSQPQGIAAGPDGNIWFTETDTNKIGRVTPDGTFTEFAMRTPTINAIGIVPGPDGALWFTQAGANRIGRITTDGKVSDLPIASPNAGVALLSAGPNGTVWVGEVFANKVARISTALTALPMDVDKHAVTGTSSNVNGVLEPGETVELSPSWKNGLAGDQTFTGSATALTGPAGPSYAINDAAANYGTVTPSATADCHDATGDCYRVTVSGARPAQHWDAQVTETIGSGYFTRTVHIGNSFTDVPTSHPFYAFIENLFHSGATGGCGSGLYCPSSTVTRAQMAVFLLKGKFGAGHIPPPATGAVFLDVHVGDFAADWIEELAGLGITGGCGGGDYCPASPVTRAQMAVFLLKSEHGAAYAPPACMGIFDDVPCPASTFAPWVEQLAAEGITAGCGGNNYCPNDPNIRGQMAVFLVKIYGLPLYGP